MSTLTEQGTQSIIKFSGSIDSGEAISVEYKCLHGANPKTLGYFLAIWQGTVIDDLSKALEIQNINTTDKDGSTTFEGLTISTLDYIVGFGVNNENGHSICATLAVPADAEQGQELEATLSTLTLVKHGSNNLNVAFSTPAYNLAKSNKNWIALFEGPLTGNMYKGTNVIKTAPVTIDQNQGITAMNDIPGGLKKFSTYTVVYGMGLKEDKIDYSNMISAYTFKI